MKYRKSFVTNSSSSSYICDFCGEVQSGWDMCLSDAGMFECVNGHTLCEYHCTENPGWIDRFKEYIKKEIRQQLKLVKEQPSKYFCYIDEEDMLSDEEIEEANYETLLDFSDDLGLEIRYQLPAELCVFCALDEICDKDMVRLILKDNNINQTEFAAIVKKRFKTYEELKKYLNSKDE